MVIRPLVFVCLRSRYPRFPMRCQWFYRFSPDQSILVGSHFEIIAVVRLYLDRISSSSDRILSSRWCTICNIHPISVPATVTDHSIWVLIIWCLLFLPHLLTSLTMSKPPRIQSFWKFQSNFVPFDLQQISKKFEESQPRFYLQVSWLLARVPRRCQ